MSNQVQTNVVDIGDTGEPVEAQKVEVTQFPPLHYDWVKYSDCKWPVGPTVEKPDHGYTLEILIEEANGEENVVLGQGREAMLTPGDTYYHAALMLIKVVENETDDIKTQGFPDWILEGQIVKAWRIKRIQDEPPWENP